MGGSALKNTVTRRYEAAEYYALEKRVTDILRSMFPNTRLEGIKAYRSKESFGDMDIVIESDNLPSAWPDWQEQIIDMFSLRPEEWFKNGNCFSFAYRQLQVDLIVTPSSEYETSLNYFAYNDLGNLAGRLAHQMGLKLGHDGMSYNWRIETYQFKNVILLTDWNKILPVLGLDPERYNQGFDTLEDIFKYVVSSPYFNKDIFLLRNRNHTSRVRDAKRKTYMEFLKWIETYEETLEQKFHAEWSSYHRSSLGNKDCWLGYLFKQIHGFEETYNQVQAEWEEAVEFKKRYNGDLVKQYTGLSGKELGEFMRWMKDTNDHERFRKGILAMNPTVIETYIKYFYDKYTGNLPVLDFNAASAPLAEDVK